MTEYERGRREGHRIGLEDGRAEERRRSRVAAVAIVCITMLAVVAMAAI